MLPKASSTLQTTLRRSASTYSFLANPVIQQPTVSQYPHDALLKGKGLMQHLTKTLPCPQAQSLLNTYFSKSSPERIRPGSVLSVTLNQAPNNFSGVLVAVRHKGPDTSFVLRNVVQRTGVEMRFNVSSPGLKEVKVIQKAEEGASRRIRRAKLYYLRDQPGKMTAISTSIKRKQAASASSWYVII